MCERNREKEREREKNDTISVIFFFIWVKIKQYKISYKHILNWKATKTHHDHRL